MSEATLREDEYHGAADSAMAFWNNLSLEKKMMWIESFASTALSGNRTSEICMSTIHRLQAGEPVSDRYLLGLMWIIRDGEDNKVENQQYK